MTTLKNKLEKMKVETESILEKIPEITNIWYEFTDVPINELIEVANEYGRQVTYSDIVGCLQLQLSVPEFVNTTCFCYSKPITPKEAVNADIL